MSCVEAFIGNLRDEAEKIVHETFPRKVVELDRLLQKPHLSLKNLSGVRKCSAESISEFSAASTNKKTLEGDARIGINKVVSEGMDSVRVEITTLMQACNTLRLWVTLLLPKIEDGNNFGVSVQEETLEEIKSVECDATNFLGQIYAYFANRAKVASKLLKNPEVKDYQRYLAEEDEKQFVNLRLMTVELRNSYSTIQDLFLKNMDKIKAPKGSGFSSMY